MQTRRWGTRRSLRRGASAAVVAFAVSVASSSWAIAQQTYNFAVPGGSLAAAITKIATTAGTSIAFPAKLAQGKKSPPISGSMSVEAALGLALAGSGLEAVSSAGGGFAIRQAGSGSAATAPAGDVAAVEVTESNASLNRDKGFKPGNAGVAARIADAPLDEIPIPIGVVTNEVISSRAFSNPLDAARYVAGVTSTGTGFAIRGFETTTNGVTINGRTGGMQPSGYGVERVEVLKGPTSILTGWSSDGGTINVVPKVANGETKKEIQAEYGSLTGQGVGVDWGGRTGNSKNLSFRFVGSGIQTEDPGAGYGRDRRLYLSPSLRWSNEEITFTSYLRFRDFDTTPLNRQRTFFLNNGNLEYFTTSRDAPVRAPDANRTQSRGVTTGSDQTYNFGSIYGLGTLTFNNQVEYTTSLLTNRFVQLAADARPKPGNIQSVLFQDTRTEFEALSARPSLSYKSEISGIGQNTLMVGYDYNRSTSRSANAFSSHTPNFVGLVDISTGDVLTPYTFNKIPALRPTVTTNNATFVIDKVDLLDKKLHITGSARSDEWVTETTSARTPATGRSYVTGAVYDLTPFLSPYVNYSNGFVPGTNDPFNNYFAPPEGRTLREAGAKVFMFDKALTLTASVYHLAQTNVSFNTASIGMPAQYVLVPAMESRGAELQLQGAITPDWLITASLAKTVAEASGDIAKNLPVPPDAAKPEWSGSVWSTYGYNIDNVGRVTFGGGMRAISQSVSTLRLPVQTPTFYRFNIPGYAIFDAMASLEKEDWRLQFNAYNIFDTDAAMPAANGLSTAMELPRSWKATYTQKF